METKRLASRRCPLNLEERIWQLFLYKSRSQFTRILCITSTPRWLQALSGLDTGTTSLSEKCSEGINIAKSLQYQCCSSVLDPLIGISKCNIEPLIVGFCQRGGSTACCRVSFRCRMACQYASSFGLFCLSSSVLARLGPSGCGGATNSAPEPCNYRK